MAGRDELTHPTRRLPDLELPTPAGEMARVRPGGRVSPVLVIAHEGACEACASYVRSLRVDEVGEWDGRVIAVRDPEGRLGLETPAVVIADQWGEIHLAHEAGEDHAFPAIDEVVQWLRYLAIQCPECQGEAY